MRTKLPYIQNVVRLKQMQYIQKCTVYKYADVFKKCFVICIRNMNKIDVQGNHVPREMVRAIGKYFLALFFATMLRWLV
jgi:UDP:flavonoid glycosyltransferase YjiC (YdhE family)